MGLILINGDGYGRGSGRGSGSGYGDGDGYGSGYGYGDGDGDGYGDGYGSGYGDGYGYGRGDGSGDGSGYGDGSNHILDIPRTSAWTAYHYVNKHNGLYRLRGGRLTSLGEEVHEPDIELCRCGLHASLSPVDARNYRPVREAVLTRVLVWGQVQVAQDKLVATNRVIVEELD